MGCENSADYAKSLLNLCKSYARYAKILRLFIQSGFAEIAGRECEFRLKAIEDDCSLCIRGVLIQVDAANMLQPV